MRMSPRPTVAMLHVDADATEQSILAAIANFGPSGCRMKRVGLFHADFPSTAAAQEFINAYPGSTGVDPHGAELLVNNRPVKLDFSMTEWACPMVCQARRHV